MPFSRERYEEMIRTTEYDGQAIVQALGFRYAPDPETAIRHLSRHYTARGLL